MPQMALADEPAIVEDAGSSAEAASISVGSASKTEQDGSAGAVAADHVASKTSISETEAAPSVKAAGQSTEPSGSETVEDDRPDGEAADVGATSSDDDEGSLVKDEPAPALQQPDVVSAPKLKTPAPSATTENARDIDAELKNNGGKVTVNSFEELNAAMASKYSGHKSVYLGNDIDVGLLMTVRGDVTLYGENSTLNKRTSNCAFQITDGAKLNLGTKGYSNTLTIKGTNGADPLITVSNNGVLVMWDGVTLADNHIQGTGGAVALQDGGRFVMEGGVIENCSAIIAGGVMVGESQCSFTMNGGTIRNCSQGHERETGGGGVCVLSGTFDMNGGVIDGCYCDAPGGAGGGVVVFPSCTFIMTGGTIKNCHATQGGGLAFVEATVQISGGSIEGNTAQDDLLSAGLGGGIYQQGGSLKVSGGAFTLQCNHAAKGSAIPMIDGAGGLGGGIFIAEGTADLGGGIIANNWADSGASDVYIAAEASATLPDAVGMNQIYEARRLDSKYAGGKIDGWYADPGEDGKRYVPIKNGIAFSAGGTTASGGKEGLSLVASYKMKPALVIILDGEETSATYDGKSHAPIFSIAGCTVDGAEKDASSIVTGAKFLPKDAVATSGPEGRRAFTDAGTYLVDDGQYATVSAADLASLLGDHADDYDVSFVVRRPAKVAIAKRRVVITTGSASKRQDGTELSSGDYHIGGDGFVDGEFDPKGAIRTTGSQTAAGSSDNTFEVVYTGGDGLPEDYLDNYEIEPHLGKLEVVSADEPDLTPAAPDGPRGDQKPSDADQDVPSNQAGSQDAGTPVARQGAYVPKHMKAAPSATAALPQTGDPTAESGPRSLAAALAGAFLTALGVLGLRRRDS